MVKNNLCLKCGWYLSPNKCQLLKIYVKPEEDYCSKFRSTILKCDICGAAINKGTIFDLESKNNFILCATCASALKTCRFCDHAATCDFETNPSSSPKLIQQKIQRGPYQAVTTVKNPDRIRETCQNGCICFSSKNGCLREINQTCRNYKYTK